MKKLICLLLAMAMLFAIVGCAKETAPEEPAVEEPAKEEPAVTEEPAAEGYELALVTDIGTIDDKSFNQGAWEGLEKYAVDNNITHKYYKPTEKTTDAYVAAIDLAIQGGAKVVVTPGFLFEPAIFQAQDLYPETKFVLLDGFPQDGTYTEFRIEENVYSVFYAEQQAGFLAGYAAVKEGYTKLGFVGGMAVPAVVRFGYGYVQGAEYAAAEMGIDSIEMKYTYVGNFAPTPENQTLAAAWYEAGTEVIFAAAGGAGSSVMAAAEAAGGKVIGVDVDQAPESETVITSAMKGLGVSVYDALTGYYADEFKGGVSESLDVTVDGVSLPMETSRFETFTKEDYDAIFAALVADTDGVASSILADTDVESVDQLGTEIVAVEVIGE